jgi:hypothetical protein
MDVHHSPATIGLSSPISDGGSMLDCCVIALARVQKAAGGGLMSRPMIA